MSCNFCYYNLNVHVLDLKVFIDISTLTYNLLISALCKHFTFIYISMFGNGIFVIFCHSLPRIIVNVTLN